MAKFYAISPETFGLLYSAIALAQGLVEAAVVLSKPLPQYFTGRTGDPAEKAIVSDRGAAQQQAAVVQAQRADIQALRSDIQQVWRAIQEQEYYRLNEHDDMVRRSHKAQGYQDKINKRYRSNAKG
ncbi:MAG: hypothetical protein ACRYFK_12210 [Janthinobacterium lividum]